VSLQLYRTETAKQLTQQVQVIPKWPSAGKTGR
jgi:hypothetical protein